MKFGVVLFGMVCGCICVVIVPSMSPSLLLGVMWALATGRVRALLVMVY